MNTTQILKDYHKYTVNFVLDKYNISNSILYKIVGSNKKGYIYTHKYSLKNKYLSIIKKYKKQKKTKKWIMLKLGITENTYIYLNKCKLKE